MASISRHFRIDVNYFDALVFEEVSKFADIAVKNIAVNKNTLNAVFCKCHTIPRSRLAVLSVLVEPKLKF